MSLDRRLAVAARMLTEPAFAARLVGPEPPSAPSLGLTEPEWAALRGIDRRHLHMAVEGYAFKRFERVAARLPETLALLDAWDPSHRVRYVTTTPMGADADAECLTFRAFLEDWQGPEEAHRLLLDLGDAEQAARVPGVRVTLALRGPLERFLENPENKDPYPARPAALSVWREPDGTLRAGHPTV